MSKSHRLGSTLVDLILVLVVLSVQCAVLYPLLERANEDARTSTCKDHLRACSTALLVYCNDWDASHPSSACVTTAQTPTQAQVIRFLSGLPRRSSTDGVLTVSWADALGAYTEYDGDSFCPSAVPHGRTPYCMKYAVDLAWHADTGRKEGDYGSPGSTVIFYEPAGWHVGDAAGIKNGLQINVAYMDGHAATVVVRNGPTGYPSKAEQKCGAAAVRLGEPMYFNYDTQTSAFHPGVADYTDPRRYKDEY